MAVINIIKKNALNVVFIVSLILAMVAYYNYDIRKTEKILNELNKEYQVISISEGINGVVTQINHPHSDIFRNNPHHALVLIDQYIKRRIRTGKELSQRLPLDEVLKEGDIIIKKSGTDLLSVYKVQGNDTVKYEFKLSDDLGYPLKKN